MRTMTSPLARCVKKWTAGPRRCCLRSRGPSMWRRGPCRPLLLLPRDGGRRMMGWWMVDGARGSGSLLVPRVEVEVRCDSKQDRFGRFRSPEGCVRACGRRPLRATARAGRGWDEGGTWAGPWGRWDAAEGQQEAARSGGTEDHETKRRIGEKGSQRVNADHLRKNNKDSKTKETAKRNERKNPEGDQNQHKPSRSPREHGSWLRITTTTARS